LAVWRYSSLASLGAAAAAVFCVLFSGHSAYFIPITIMVGMIFWRHESNIKRLRAGTESKFKV
jgi:glycerol-3-phosphate acyltransferase PlsY